MSRIIGQCNTADFKSIEHLALTLTDSEMLDVSTLNRKQRLALLVMVAFREVGIKPQETYKVREVLFWDDSHIEFRFLDKAGAHDLHVKLQQAQEAFARGLKYIIRDSGDLIS